jgi:transcription antitermination factor NusG
MQKRKIWYALYTKQRWEKKVAELLTEKKIENYCPVNKVYRKWSDRKKLISEPLFSCYVFVQVDETEQSLIRSTPGVINFVYWLNKPAVIRPEEIQAIREFMHEYEYVQIERIPVKPNDTVRIVNGILEGQKGQVISINKRTAKLILPNLGFMMHAEIRVSQVEPDSMPKLEAASGQSKLLKFMNS